MSNTESFNEINLIEKKFHATSLDMVDNEMKANLIKEIKLDRLEINLIRLLANIY